MNDLLQATSGRLGIAPRTLLQQIAHTDGAIAKFGTNGQKTAHDWFVDWQLFDTLHPFVTDYLLATFWSKRGGDSASRHIPVS